MNIVLIGFRCSGKTSVGTVLAERLGREFRDTDLLVEERAGMPIPRIVETRGWEGFRKLERQIVREISCADNLIIATGGGVIAQEGNLGELRRNGWLVWLDGEPHALKERMKTEQKKGKSRPPLTGLDPAKEFEEVYAQRIPVYEKGPDLRVDTSRLSVSETAGCILNNLPGDWRHCKCPGIHSARFTNNHLRGIARAWSGGCRRWLPGSNCLVPGGFLR